MSIYIVLLCIIIILCLALAFMLFHSYRLRQQIQELKKKPTAQTVELQAFLGDLMTGEGLVSVNRVDPNHLFTYSPRDTTS